MLARTSPTGTTERERQPRRQPARTTRSNRLARGHGRPFAPTWRVLDGIANGHDRRRWSGLGRRGRGRLTSCRFGCAWGWRRSRGRQEPTAAALACRPEPGQLLTNRGHFGLQCRETVLEARAPLL